MEVHLGIEERRQRKREYQRRYLERHPEKRKESCKKYNNKPEVKERFKKWTEENHNQYALKKKEYVSRNKEKCYAIVAAYVKENPGWKASHCAKRRARKLQAIPNCITQEQLDQIKEIYKEASLKGLVVDHIVPLQGKKVSGLHVPWNLQLLTATENSKKSNKFED